MAEKYVVTFKPGKEMEERVKQLMSDEEHNASHRSAGTRGHLLPHESAARCRASHHWDIRPPATAANTATTGTLRRSEPTEFPVGLAHKTADVPDASGNSFLT